MISGEEEAAYAWAGVNYATGALLGGGPKGGEGGGGGGGGEPAGWGSGTASPANAFGTLEMGGASHQMAFFQPEQSVLSSLFKLQVGGGPHWNLYAHSHLQYGRVSAKARMWARWAAKGGGED